MSSSLLLLATLMASATAALYDVALSFTGLEDLGDDYRYEGWLVNGNGAVTTGIFQAEADGSFEGTFPRIDGKIGGEAAETFVLTIEPYPDEDPSPAATHVYAGALADMGTAAPITVDHSAALGSDFTSAAGNYFLAAPTGPADFSLGIWWLGGDPPGYTLPTLPEGWAYEGWVVSDATGPVSTGRFTDPAGADSDGAGPAAGDEPGPAAPGQDFIDPPMDLTSGFTAVLSIEPEPDNSPAPFAFKPLVHDIVAMEEGAVQMMDQNLDSLGSGEVTLTPSAPVYDVALSFMGLEDLGDDYRYEGWLVNGNGAVTTGIFQAESDGSFEGTFEGITGEIGGEKAETFVLTIEPYPDSDPSPAATHVYAGALADMGTAAPITVDHAAALGSDFTSAAGNYFLAAPTGPADFSLGIWWLGGDPPGYTLPTLPEGWADEGWVVSDDSGPVSTGRFTDPAGADSDGAGPAAGDEPGPAAPGQDFINPPMDLTMGFTAVLSIEPEPDNSPAPFAFKPLIHEIVAMEEGAVQMMDQNLDSLGSGEVTLTASKSVATSGVASTATVFVAALLSMAVAAMMA